MGGGLAFSRLEEEERRSVRIELQELKVVLGLEMVGRSSNQSLFEGSHSYPYKTGRVCRLVNVSRWSREFGSLGARWE